MAIEAADEPIDDFDETDETVAAGFSITSYGADYPVDGLVKRIGQGDIVVPIFNADPVEGQTAVSFQREFVWRKPQADRFVESLLLGLPVPGIFLVKEANRKLLLLDGHQRLKTLESFYRGIFQGQEFTLANVQDQWKGKSYSTLNADDRRRLSTAWGRSAEAFLVDGKKEHIKPRSHPPQGCSWRISRDEPSSDQGVLRDDRNRRGVHCQLGGPTGLSAVAHKVARQLSH